MGEEGGSGGEELACPAGVSSFGFGGAMAHLIVDSAGASQDRPLDNQVYYPLPSCEKLLSSQGILCPRLADTLGRGKIH